MDLHECKLLRLFLQRLALKSVRMASSRQRFDDHLRLKCPSLTASSFANEIKSGARSTLSDPVLDASHLLNAPACPLWRTP